MNFQYRHWARKEYPQKHVLICEDDTYQQKRFLEHFLTIFDPQGNVQFSVVCGTVVAAAMIKNVNIDVIVLDHDLPQGNGSDLLQWMKTENINIPVITASGIPQNNENMRALGAHHIFGKEDVINGKADEILLDILGMNQGVAESYVNRICINEPTARRYWVTPKMMVGGSIVDIQDWQHLQSQYRMRAVINVESEHSDHGKNIEHLCEVQTPDNGTPFSPLHVTEALLFARKVLPQNSLYIHCQMGGSRSPAYAYAVLRDYYKMSPEDALAKIQVLVPQYGWHPYQQAYLGAVESVLK